MRLLKIALIVLSLIIFIIACGQTPENNNSVNKTNNNIPANNTAAVTNAPVNAPDIAQNETASGRKIFNEICANCHKEDGTGGKVTIEGKTINPDNLTTDKMKKMADAKYVDYIENGVPDEGMPAFKDKLSDEEIKTVISYIRTELQK